MPPRESHLTEADKILAIKNALRYIHPDHHEQMAKEFAQELEEHGRIYGYRFRPEGKLYGKPIDEYKGNCIEGKSVPGDDRQQPGLRGGAVPPMNW